MIRQTLLLLTAFLISQSALFGQSEKTAIYEDTEAYKVYAAILSTPLRATDDSRSKNFVIQFETQRHIVPPEDKSSSPTCLHPDAESAKVIGTAIENFVKINQVKWQLQPKFNLAIPYQLVNPEIFIKEGWQSFPRKFPGTNGFTYLSAVGFNADKTVAVVYKQVYCGLDCASGDYYVLQKKDEKWVPLEWRGARCYMRA
jgi:hypothetical protein